MISFPASGAVPEQPDDLSVELVDRLAPQRVLSVRRSMLDPEPGLPGPPRQDAPEPVCPAVTSPSFIGTFPEEMDQAVIVLRGEIDAATVERLGAHVEDLLAVHTRFLTIEAGGVDSYEAGLLDLLGDVQHRLGTRRGLLTVRGLHPCLLAAATPPSREPAPADRPRRGPVVSATE